MNRMSLIQENLEGLLMLSEAGQHSSCNMRNPSIFSRGGGGIIMCAKCYYMIESKSGSGGGDKQQGETDELDRLKKELILSDKWENEVATILLNKELSQGKKIERIKNSMHDIEKI